MVEGKPWEKYEMDIAPKKSRGKSDILRYHIQHVCSKHSTSLYIQSSSSPFLGQALPMAFGPQVSSLPHQWWPSWYPWSYLSLGHRWFKAEEVSKLMAFPSAKYPTKIKTFRRADFFDWTPHFTVRLTWGLWKLVVVNKNKRLQDLENGTGGWFPWVLYLKSDSLMKVYTPLHKINCNPIQLTTWRFIFIPSRKWSHPGCGYSPPNLTQGSFPLLSWLHGIWKHMDSCEPSQKQLYTIQVWEDEFQIPLVGYGFVPWRV